MLSPKIIACFNQQNDGKRALGRIKQDCWNRVALTMIIPTVSVDDDQNDHYEIAAENFTPEIDEEKSPFSRTEPTLWNGIAPVYLASVPAHSENKEQFLLEQQPMLTEKLLSRKVVTVVEIEPEQAGQARWVIESNGGEIMQD